VTGSPLAQNKTTNLQNAFIILENVTGKEILLLSLKNKLVNGLKKENLDFKKDVVFTLKTCTGKKCTNGPTRCFNSGKPLTTETNGKCEWQTLPKGHGRVEVCCKVTKQCEGEDCKESRTDCKKTRTILTTSMSRCRWVPRADGSKQRRCCSWVRRCEKGICSIQSPNCVWVGDAFTSKKKSVCNWKVIPNGKQRQCCSYTLRCIGKNCYSSKYDCKDIGAPHTVVRSQVCKLGCSRKWKKTTKML